MADLKIYNNGENKILFSAGDRIIRQPYDFGKSFQNQTNQYFELSNIELPSSWGIATVADYPTDSDGGNFQAIATSINLADNLPIRGGANGITFCQYIDSTGFGPGGGVSNKSLSLRYSHSDPSGFSYFDSINSMKIRTNSARNNAVRDKIRVGASGHYTSNSANISFHLPNTWKLNTILMFDRELELSELLYFQNNLLYSELQTTSGLIHQWKFSGVENIDNVISVRDLVGDWHLPLLNTPAGTLQEQLDWANTALFVPFIS